MPTAEGGAVELELPFTDRWRAGNSPARRVPSHGSDLMGERYAIDFVGVDRAGRSARRNDWRTAFATEPADRFFAFGRPILAPLDGIVVEASDGEDDHLARRSQFALVGYALGQPGRLRRGVRAIAGNVVVIARPGSAVFVALVHLRAGSLLVRAGDRVSVGQPLAECGNSGNSTQPHLHLQAMDSADLSVARGLPITFRTFREWSRKGGMQRDLASGIPSEGAVVEPLATDRH
jgi:hypothetical protein